MERDRKVGISDLGGCVDGVSISRVRATSKGAKMMPAMPAAPTAAKRLAKGDGEERISRPPIAEGIGRRYGGWDCENKRPGSGRSMMAQIIERVKEVIVFRRIE